MMRPDTSRVIIPTVLLLVLQARLMKAQCTAASGFVVEQEGKYHCKLKSPDWPADAAFEVTLRHCKSAPILNILIRHFQGVDGINHDFSMSERAIRTTNYNGKPSLISVGMRIEKSNAIKGHGAQLHVKVYFKPILFSPYSQQPLTAVFPWNERDGCDWYEKLDHWQQIFTGMAFAAVILTVIILTLIVVMRRKKRLANHSVDRGQTYL